MNNFQLLAKKSLLVLLALIGGITPNLLFATQAKAVYEERGGVYGEIKYFRFCNIPGAFISTRVVSEAGSRGPTVNFVSFKIYSAYSINGFGYNLGVTTPAWRDFRIVRNSQGISQRFYDTGNLGNPLVSAVATVPIKVSQHVFTSNGTVIDLGGILDLGIVPVGKCSVYDNGNRYTY